ncbi:MAG: putative metal-dependent hydrolase [Candidatus Azotimanducaceae bacterium]|jgi:predicted metal-dependent hydrolase
MANIELEEGRLERMVVRQVPFDFGRENGHWNSNSPEMSHIVNSASLAMPYLEPYLIRTMRAARPLIDDEVLQAELDLYVKQEATHYKQHRRFNDTLREKGYVCIDDLESRLAKDYEELESTRSLKFNLAYAEGFESMALALGEMLIEDRNELFAGAAPSVTSLVLWHFVEEIEHKNVAYDVFDYLHGSYVWRMFGLVYATGHIFWRTGQGYRALLKEDGLWNSLSMRWRLAKLLVKLIGRIAPRWFRIWRPKYHPSQVEDPIWGRRWVAQFERDPASLAQLDTSRLQEDYPVLNT